MFGERARQPGESDESWTAHCSLVATLPLRAILAIPEGRQALKALLTKDAPALAAKATLLRLTYHGPNPDDVKAALAAAVDAFGSPEGKGR